jgi:hypothetical protein
MKTKIFFKYAYLFGTFFFSMASGFGQLTVNDYGSVSIGDGIPANEIRLKVTTSQRIGQIWHYGLVSSFANMSQEGNFNGIYGLAYRTTAISIGRSYGVMGIAGNYRSGYNYGVYGRILGSNNGAGVFGTVNGDKIINGKYAGFFNGNVDVTGVLSVNGVAVLTSDERTKKNIKPLSETNNSLNGLLGLRPVSYNQDTDFAQTFLRDPSDTVSKNEGYVDPQLADRIQRGFIAQELQEIFPDLVFEDNDGVLSVNYIGLIPVIVDALKELQNHISFQEERIGRLEKALNGKTPIWGAQTQEDYTAAIIEDNEMAVSILYQNHPNPFHQETTIRYYIPESVKNASLHIYDMQGIEIESYFLASRGYSSTILGDTKLIPGMYLYALIADGKEVDTKRMILTE